ncbi:MAG: hypothetical protein DCC43_05310 [Candidatus Brocadia sp.]|uniref:Uncharacterized protein n=1 Tax=Candidatus Brocadia fulgida TaxID=380242 RepID=A0A0M2USX9_9BACT|nr:MAG: hypothetical protein BROFUL_02596 [Candidatus Brocadia fulgida]MCE7910496.1 hypothetical protein [Candidatus Brocadia sp. AMX3]RIK01830.1 MAG: hypothetical protein DCC43_05310 [Candidatus Brocadia sp.]
MREIEVGCKHEWIWGIYGQFIVQPIYRCFGYASYWDSSKFIMGIVFRTMCLSTQAYANLQKHFTNSYSQKSRLKNGDK